jgi:hypothetical protein
MRLQDAVWAFFVVLLAAFSYLLWVERQPPEKTGQWTAKIYEVPMLFQIVIPEELDKPWADGQATRRLNEKCKVFVDARVLTKGMEYFAYLLAHEAGHCLEIRGEGIGKRWYSTSEGASRAGCRFGDYFCDPTEGFAETWARLYIQRCGFNLATFGWPSKEKSCRYTPAPGAATPEAAAKLPLDWNDLKQK